jgi:hypothetical protein
LCETLSADENHFIVSTIASLDNAILGHFIIQRIEIEGIKVFISLPFTTTLITNNEVFLFAKGG